MEDIIKKLMENHRVDEMAMEQSKAISMCRSLGKQFIEHFHKVYVGGLKDRDYKHHCHEMQTWYNDAKSIKLKSNNKVISRIHLVDWFFTVGAGVDDFLHDEDEIDMYEEFTLKLLTDPFSDVEDALDKLLSN